MGFSSLFIRRPIATSLLMLALLLLGVIGYRALPVAALPDIDAPSLIVTTQYPGASASTMATLVTTPLERQFGQISGVATMTSDSSAGLSTIIIEFDKSRDIDAAGQDVQSAINAARGTLPTNLPYPPIYNKVNPADAPILTLMLTSDTRPLREVNDYADSILAQRLSQISGVGLVSIAGNVRPAVRVQVNPAQIANLGLTMEDVRSALTQANVNAPKGSLNGTVQSFSIGTNDQLADAADYRSTIISYNAKTNAPVLLSDVAKVVDGVENDQLAAWANAKPAVLLDVRRQPGANIVQTVAEIQQQLPQLRALLPADVKLQVFSDRTVTIRASVEDVEFTLVLTICLVIAVIFVFLRRLWATVIPSVAVPLSLLGTFGVMAFAGFSLDNLSLMALTVATGFVVDDAIVMIENIVRYIEQGKQPREAAEVGAKEIGFTVLSLTVSLIAVFLPLLLMPGVTGRLFHEFAWVLTIAVAISMFISLTLTPMMCAYLLKADALPAGDHADAHAHTKDDAWSRILAGYGRSLDWVLARQPLMLLVASVTVVVTIALYVTIPKGLLPEQDTGLVTGVVQADQNIAFPAMEERTKAVADALRGVPGVAGIAAFVGAGSINPTLNQGQLSIVLKPRGERDGLDALRHAPGVAGIAAFVGAGSINPTLNQGQLSLVLKDRGDREGLDTVLPRLQKAVAGIAGVALYLKPVQDVTLDTQVSATEYQYSLSDVNSTELA
ncbi:efflux RND transporter permease subunit, partial [Dokdonella sp.]|uniref:efflux RND transporter permease subunit n=1 Tax=Dokdonella sp. TaxID=2291710 RepID=UPI0026301978